jgi:hypothetical protein
MRHRHPRLRTILILLALLIGFFFGGVPAAHAQTADPVGLIASAAIMPFWATGAHLTVFELTSLGENPAMHAFFFDANCRRVFSLPFAMTAHDASIAFSTEFGLNFNGLVAIAGSENNISPSPLEAPITLRGHRVDLVNDALSVIDPIGAVAAEDPTRLWNPLRSGASTVTVPSSTLWHFVCPQSNSHLRADLFGIPPLPPAPDLIRMRVFDLDENPLLDIQVSCGCLTTVVVDQLHPIFDQDNRYVEMVATLSERPIANAPAFVMYRQVNFDVGGFKAEEFARAPGIGAATLLSGVAVPIDAPIPAPVPAPAPPLCPPQGGPQPVGGHDARCGVTR